MMGILKTLALVKNVKFANHGRYFMSNNTLPHQIRRFKATATGLINDQESLNNQIQDHNLPDPAFQKIDLEFENAREAYKSKRNSELVRALFVFNLCSIKPLVDHNKEVSRYSMCYTQSYIIKMSMAHKVNVIHNLYSKTQLKILFEKCYKCLHQYILKKLFRGQL